VTTSCHLSEPELLQKQTSKQTNKIIAFTDTFKKKIPYVNFST